MELAITTSLIDHDVINASIENLELIIIPRITKPCDTTTFVTKIVPIKRKRKDNIQRYTIEITTTSDADQCYCDNACGCGGDLNTWVEESGPLTSIEFAQRFYFYPKYVIGRLYD